MTLLVAWIVFPVALGLLSLGCGLLLERLSGSALETPLLLPVGFATVVVVAGLATAWSPTAQLATPAVIALAILGLGLSPPWRRGLERWAALAAGGVFAAYAAPVVLSGRATFAGYVKLDDTSTWLGIADWTIRHGRDLSSLPPSTYQATLSEYVGQTGYPIGSIVPIGLGQELVRVDSAWLFQPYLAFQAALLALALYVLVSRLVGTRWLRALVAFVAAQATLLYGYALWGSVKELVTVVLVALLATLAAAVIREPARSPRALAPLAVACAAVLATLNVGGGAWLALAILPTLVVAILVPPLAFAARAAVFAALVLVLSIPTLVTLDAFYEPAKVTLEKSSEFGNLSGPLSSMQIFGIWLTGDFRARPRDLTVTYVLIGALVAAAVLAVAVAARRRAWELPLYLWISVVGYVLLARVGSPWVDAKALATASPAPVAAGMVGAALLFERGRRVAFALLAAAIAGGVLWSNALAYHDAWLAPSSRLAELETIGHRFAGDGPTLMTDFEVYGVKHFLRNMAPTSTATLGPRPFVLADGTVPSKGVRVDVDRLALDDVLAYRTLVLRRSPVASRPPSAFELAWSGRYYEVWRQRPDASRIVEHLPLGSRYQAGAVPDCAEVLRLGALAARDRGRLATVVRPPALVVKLGAPGPALPYGEDVTAVAYLRHRYEKQAAVEAPARGVYGVWVGGSFRSRLAVAVDGQTVGAERDQLNWPDDFEPLGDVTLARGVHGLALTYDGPSALRPGSAGEPPFGTGPLVVAQGTADRPVRYVRPANARSLCGERLDWIEVVTP